MGTHSFLLFIASYFACPNIISRIVDDMARKRRKKYNIHMAAPLIHSEDKCCRINHFTYNSVLRQKAEKKHLLQLGIYLLLCMGMGL